MSSDIDQTLTSIDHEYLSLCFHYKSSLPRGPLHSNFKVFSLFTFTMNEKLQQTESKEDKQKTLSIDNANNPYYANNGSHNLEYEHPYPHNENPSSITSSGVIPVQLNSKSHTIDSKPVYYITGSNVELCFTGLGICAERAACCSLRQINYSKVHALYLVSDLNSELTCGLLCREFLHNFISRDTPIIMAAQPNPNKSPNYTTRITTLRQLYKFPCLFMNISAPFLETWAKGFLKTAQNFSEFCGQLALSNDSKELYENLYKSCISHTELDNSDTINAIRLSAVVLFDDYSYDFAHQTKLLEYGYSLTPISKLVGIMENKWRNMKLKPILILQTDRYGILHSPFAPDRGHMTENYNFKNCSTIIHSESGKLVQLQMNELIADQPDLVNALSQQQVLFQAEKEEIAHMQDKTH